MWIQIPVLLVLSPGAGVKKTKQKPKAHKSIRIVGFECTLHLANLNLLMILLTETDQDYFPLALGDASARVQDQLRELQQWNVNSIWMKKIYFPFPISSILTSVPTLHSLCISSHLKHDSFSVLETVAWEALRVISLLLATMCSAEWEEMNFSCSNSFCWKLTGTRSQDSSIWFKSPFVKISI